ncbi:TIGR01777 family oxidoreductase [Bacillus pinisoli]|uniref:TIGR01777 family oxidoreductase n=1 Tax=Bacillus pinisoli TaxID=2901866 RepID=UPI001FF2A39A|nr:TIGR01777 family oxidoreductase [Bacillus pinisoli]
MKIAITGGTGFVGKALTKSFLQGGHNVYILSRSQHSSSKDGIQYVKWLTEDSQPENELNDIDVFINLAGESLNSGRWTAERKQRIVSSRISATREVIRILQNMNKKPSVLINASAIGYYGTSLEKEFTESNKIPGQDFLAQTVASWEQEAQAAEELGVRTVYTRFGIILDQQEGALPKMVLPYKLFAGGTVGSGAQWMSWVHIDDVVGMIQYAIKNENIKGPFNVVSSNPVTMKKFGQHIGHVMKRPHFLPAPSFALKLLLGEMSVLVLEGQKVVPQKAEDSGYQFHYKYLDEALTNILK